MSKRVATHAPQRWFPPIMPREEFLKTDYVRSFPDLVGSIDVFTGGDKEHRALLEVLEAGGDWTDAPHAGRGGAAVVGLPPALRHAAARHPGRGARRGVQRLVVPPRAEPRPGPDADLPDLRVREDRYAGAVAGAPRRVARARPGRAHRARAAGPLRGRQRPVLRPGRQDARRQPARLAAEVRDVRRPHRGEADRDRLVELPRGPLRPLLRPAPGRRHAGAQRLHRLRARPDHPGAVRRRTAWTSRPGPRRCGPRWRCSADRSAWGSRRDVDRRARAHPGVVRARVASAATAGSSRPAGGVARGGVDPLPADGGGGRAAHRTFRRLAEELADGRHRRAPLRLRRHR